MRQSLFHMRMWAAEAQRSGGIAEDIHALLWREKACTFLVEDGIEVSAVNLGPDRFHHLRIEAKPL